MELKTDIEFENKIPPLSSEELMRLEDSILSEGRLISPIVVWNGIIVDGHNRYRIIQENPDIRYEIYEKDSNRYYKWILKKYIIGSNQE